MGEGGKGAEDVHRQFPSSLLFLDEKRQAGREPGEPVVELGEDEALEPGGDFVVVAVVEVSLETIERGRKERC